jgi:hypothetical protein
MVIVFIKLYALDTDGHTDCTLWLENLDMEKRAIVSVGELLAKLVLRFVSPPWMAAHTNRLAALRGEVTMGKRRSMRFACRQGIECVAHSHGFSDGKDVEGPCSPI